ncbi:MAG: hypothetical protein QW097_00650 [archaeon]
MRDKLIAILFFGILFFSTLEPISFAISKEIDVTPMYKLKIVKRKLRLSHWMQANMKGF